MTGASAKSIPLRLVQAFVLLLVAAFAASQFAELHFMLDNLTNFPVHFAGAFLLCTVVLAILRDLRFALVAAAGAVTSLAPVVPWYFDTTDPQPASGATTVAFLVSNVHVDNRRHAKLLRLIEKERPDVIGLVEVNSRWLRKLAPLRSIYPFHFEIPDEASIGLALYSKLPLSNARFLHAGEAGTPAVAATMETPDGELEIILAHPMSPLNPEHVRRRNAQLAALARYVSTLQRPVVVAGDLNATMWNRNYRAFAERGGLQNARAGHGIGATWPSIGSLGVPIDHILATEPVRFRNFRVLESIDSDHLPVSAEFSLR